MENMQIWEVPDGGMTQLLINEIVEGHWIKKEWGITIFCSQKLLLDFIKNCNRDRYTIRPSEMWENYSVHAYLCECGLRVVFSPVEWDFNEDKIGVIAKDRRLLPAK
jgi:phenolic acid decarboxylase